MLKRNLKRPGMKWGTYIVSVIKHKLNIVKCVFDIDFKIMHITKVSLMQKTTEGKEGKEVQPSYMTNLREYTGPLGVGWMPFCMYVC